MMTCRRVDATGMIESVQVPNDVVRCYGPVDIHPSALLGPFVAVGYPKEQRLLGEVDELQSSVAPTTISQNVCVGSNVTIGEGSVLHPGVLVDDHVRIGFGCEIGEGTRLLYGAFICDRVVIGRDAKVAGFVCDAARIGNNATVMGDLVHDYTQPHITWGIE